MDDTLPALAMASLAALVVILFIEWLARALRPNIPPPEFATDIYQGGEAVRPRKRRYLEQTHVYAAVFTILHVISFMIASFTAVIFAAKPEGFDSFNPALGAYLAVTFATVGILIKRNWSLTA